MPLVSAWTRLLEARYALDSSVDEIHRVRADDDVAIAVKRFRPAGGDGPPVLCVPGLGADSHNFDAPAPYGLARRLADEGFDAWVVDLRGTGMSGAPKGRWTRITFDDFVSRDIPAVVEHIAKITRRDDLYWVGHSMGGMVLYACLGTGRANRVRAGVTIGSPVGFPERWSVAPIAGFLRGLGGVVPGLFPRVLMRTIAPALFRTRFQPEIDRFVETQNVDDKLVRRLAFHAVQDIPRGVLLQFRDWLEHDAFRSRDKRIDYRARMAGARTPVLVVVGPKDRLGTPQAAERALFLLEEAELLTCGREQGFSVDYGHIDLVFGRQAPTEVFPRIVEYLRAHEEARRSSRGRLLLVSG